MTPAEIVAALNDLAARLAAGGAPCEAVRRASTLVAACCSTPAARHALAQVSLFEVTS